LALAEATVPQIATVNARRLNDVEAALDACYLGRDVPLAEGEVLKFEPEAKTVKWRKTRLIFASTSLPSP
jgi:hypothetical protein